MKQYLRLLEHLRPYKFRLCVAAICTALASAGTVVLPWIIKDLVDQVLSEKDAEKLTYIALSVVVIFLFRGFFFYGQSYLISYVGQRVVIDIRREVFKKIQRLSMAFYDKNKTGTIMSYVTNDVNALQTGLVDNIVEMITESVILIASIVAMIYLDWKLFLFSLCTFPVVIMFIDFFGKKIRASGSRIQGATADLTSILQEVVSSARVIKSFVREAYEIDRFEAQNMHNFRAQMKYVKLSATLTPTIEFVAAIGVT
ncbi:MAG: ABC transporter ATP-binding protein, partial [Phascolarctobacterium sp.]|nr:ABC transporter ATP-binding protein [Phascolarctobacterium sp.]